MAKKLLTLLLLTCLLCSCEKGQTIDKQTLGGAIGVISGSVLGSKLGGGTGRIVSIVLGSFAGAVAGSYIGKQMDLQDLEYYERTSQYTLEHMPTGQVQSWHNTNTGNWGTFKPTKTFQTAQGSICREYQQKIMLENNEHSGYGTACRAENGNWELIN
jgi:surface antigen